MCSNPRNNKDGKSHYHIDKYAMAAMAPQDKMSSSLAKRHLMVINGAVINKTIQQLIGHQHSTEHS